MGLTWRFIFEPVSGLANWILNTGFGLEKWTWLSHKTPRVATLMFVDCWQWTPFIALILLAGMQSISPEITEAARLDRGARRHLLLAHRHSADPPGHHGGDPDPAGGFDPHLRSHFIMTKGGPGSSTLLASVYDYTIFEQGHLGLMAAYGFLILILINIVVLAFLNTLYRTEKAARAADQP